MSLLRCIDLTKSYGDQAVLQGVSLEISPGEKIGLVGNNGAGKTTLANIIAGELEPDGGTVLRYDRTMRIGYLRQATSYTLKTFNELFINQRHSPEDFLEFTSQLGLARVTRWDEERFRGLSGGERTKLALAQVWASRPDLLILDEPTNHMDFHGAERLVEEMRTFPGATLIISHDRWFLDQVVKRLYELEGGRAREYAGNYSFYRAEKQRLLESQLQNYLDEQKEQRRIEQEIRRLKQWSAKGHREAGKNREFLKEYGRKQAKKRDQQIKSRIKMLERMQTQGTARPLEESKPEFEFDPAGRRGRRLIEAKGLGKGYNGRILFGNSDFFILRGEKVGLVGPNGCGKTTLLRIILNQEEQDGGELWLSPSLRPGYLSQDVLDMDEEKNALEILGVVQKEEVTRARTLLANMGFDAAMVTKPVGKLSLGERTRIKLAGMILQENDLLILDEPTNHLDLHSREKLEETLLDYNGTLLIVSHDRYLLERVCDSLLVFEEQTIIKMNCRFDQYREAEQRQQGQTAQEEKLVIETRMAWLIAELGKHTPGDPEYAELDREFRELAKKKRELAEGR